MASSPSRSAPPRRPPPPPISTTASTTTSSTRASPSCVIATVQAELNANQRARRRSPPPSLSSSSSTLTFPTVTAPDNGGSDAHGANISQQLQQQPSQQAGKAATSHHRVLLLIVGSSSLAFAALLVFLAPVLYPLLALIGVYVILMQQQRQTHSHEETDTAVDQPWSGAWYSAPWRWMPSALTNWFASDPVKDKPQDDTTDVTTDGDDAATDSPSALRKQPRVKHRHRIPRTPRDVPSLRMREIDALPTTNDDARQQEPTSSGSRVVHPNAPHPYEFENALLKGRVLFLMQPHGEPDAQHPREAPILKLPSSYAALFAGKRRLFWIQLQVQFKQVPAGILYIGGEVPHAMQLGFFTTGLTKLILRVLQSLVRGLHCSFGHGLRDNDKKNSGGDGTSDDVTTGRTAPPPADEELPHICFPLYTAVDQFVVTPPGGVPPTLGTADFGESKEDMAARRKHGAPMYEYNTKDTYSFHFHSFFIDFWRWRLVGLPGVKETALAAFWGDMPLRLCAYSLREEDGVDMRSEAVAKAARHTWHAKAYQFCFELSHKLQEPLPEELEEDENKEDGRSLGPGQAEDGEGTEGESRMQRLGRGLGPDVALQLTAVQQALSCYSLSIPVWIEYLSSSRSHTERRVAYVFLVQEFKEPQHLRHSEARGHRDHSSRVVTAEYLVLHTALAAFSPLAFIEHELPSLRRRRGSRGHRGNAHGNDGNGSSGGFFSRSRPRRQSLTTSGDDRSSGSRPDVALEDTITVRSRTNRAVMIEKERVFLDRELQRLQVQRVGDNASIRGEQLLAAQSVLLELVQRQTPTSLAAEWPFLSASRRPEAGESCKRSSSSAERVMDAAMDSPGGSDSDEKESVGDGIDDDWDDREQAGHHVDPHSPRIRRREVKHATIQIVRAVSATQWRNEWVTFDHEHRVVRFFRMMASSPSLVVPLTSVLYIQDDPVWHSPLTAERNSSSTTTLRSEWHAPRVEREHEHDDDQPVELFWVRVALLTKCHHLAFTSREERRQWRLVLQLEMERERGLDTRGGGDRLGESPSLAAVSDLTETTQKEDGVKRALLNDRCGFLFHTPRTVSRAKQDRHGDTTQPIPVTTLNTQALVAQTLRVAIALHQRGGLRCCSTQEWLAFLDACCALQWVDLRALRHDTDGEEVTSMDREEAPVDREQHRKVFFLNLYHLIMVHASLLDQLPRSRTQWSPFFNGMNYLVGGFRFSLADIEHAIIRAPMSSVKIPLAFLIIPTIRDDDPRSAFRLTSGDFRLNFALNCLTKSCASSIVVFDLDASGPSLSAQLDAVTTLTVERVMSYDRERKTLFLPKLCEWYRDDFAASSGDESGHWQHDTLVRLSAYLTGSKAQMFAYLVANPDTEISKWKFAKYDYRFHEAISEYSVT